MIKRFFSFYKTSTLVYILSFFYILILMPSDTVLLVGFVQNIAAMIFMTVVILTLNLEAIISNWKYIVSGLLIDRDDKYMSKSNLRLKEARLGKTNPLFVFTQDKTFYYHDNYSKGES